MIDRVLTVFADRRPSLRVPPTKPPTSFASSCSALLMRIYSAKVSGVVVGFSSRASRAAHVYCLFFQCLSYRFLPVEIQSRRSCSTGSVGGNAMTLSSVCCMKSPPSVKSPAADRSARMRHTHRSGARAHRPRRAPSERLGNSATRAGAGQRLLSRQDRDSAS